MCRAGRMGKEEFTMEERRRTGTPYDDVFRTLLNDCSSLIIPVINEVFGEAYSGKEEIVFAQNEHFLNRQDGEEEERITDTSFKIVGRETRKYHLECQSSPDNSMLIRFFEYDTQIALDDGVRSGNVLTVTFPHSAVLFLRCNSRTPDEMKIRMITPGGTVEYRIFVMKSRNYTIGEIFEKELLLLIPFYIFSHEHLFGEYEQDETKLELLISEYKEIRSHLEELSKRQVISEYAKCTIVDMSNKVVENLAGKYDSVRKGVKAVMGGKVLEYEAKTIRDEGMKEGMEKGMEKGMVKGIKGTVDILKNLGFPAQEILVQIQSQYGLSQEASRQYLK